MKVKFLPQNVEFEIQPGQSVMNLAHEKGIPIHSSCNGMPSCAECRVRVVEGDYNLLQPSRKELNLIGTGYYIDQRRLSCQLMCFGDVVIDTQEHVDRLGSGPVTKKFLSRVQKDSADQSYSVGDVLIEKDEELMKQLESSGVEESEASHDGELFNQMLQSPDRKGGGGGGGGRDRGRGGRDRNRGGGQRQGGGQDRHASGGGGQARGQGGNQQRHQQGGGGGGQQRSQNQENRQAQGQGNNGGGGQRQGGGEGQNQQRQGGGSGRRSRGRRR